MNLKEFSILRKKNGDVEMVFIKPILLGGDVSEDNIDYILREQHFEYVKYWNNIIRALKSKSQSKSI
ncbi:hypothetical protein [Pasteurella testudinis]|uniref:hypothetical protein n=1 Tax=Pasteurella testudinis TaxID=761 RepID=UPI00405846D0